ncbi:hypothetical protein QN277_021124 [Acacia crassicarpa]|uniref:Uncharacterized protein n=1 Tax=Acacia crassicarpa TaxID=499986 RepID=A0AAE1MT67_9FABA|nr:hypothetical protein QN277_021124 [Acacia crassicarpa]
MEIPASASVKVQHITKKSSDELLRKFADDSDKKPRKKKDLRATKRRKKNWAVTSDGECESPSSGSTPLLERRSPLPIRRPAMLRLLRIESAQLRLRDVGNEFLLSFVAKVWRRTIQGASRVFIEKHYYRHKILNIDIS